MQTHNCAMLDRSCYDQCRAEEHCQYKLTTVDDSNGPIFCGKDQLIALALATSGGHS